MAAGINGSKYRHFLPPKDGVCSQDVWIRRSSRAGMTEPFRCTNV